MKRARLALGLVGAVAIVEVAAAAVSYRARVRSEDWEAARVTVEALPEAEPVWLATEWIGPRARMTLPRLAAIDAAARPDLRGAPRFAVLGVDAAWSHELQLDLEDMPMPRAVATVELGPLTLTQYENAAAGSVVADLVRDVGRMQVFVDAARCKGQARRWRCNLGHVDLLTAEVDYRPRRCLAVTADDGVVVRMLWPQTQTGDVLRGHVGFHDFNRRLRSDAAAELTVIIDDAETARWLATDAEGWQPFAIATTRGVHDVAIEVVVSARGTWWDREGYDASKAHAPCIELRSLQEGEG